MFDFLKKNKEDVPPDVGQEEEFDKENNVSLPEETEMPNANPKGIKLEKPKEIDYSASASNLEIEKMQAQLESVIAWIKQFYERFSYVSESIGEIRAMNLANEKRIMEATKEADKVIDIVKEVKPEKLRFEYQRYELRLKEFEEKVEADKLMVDEVMKEIKDLRRKSEIFIGTDALMDLNSDTKKDLVEMNKINSMTKMHADKSEQIFEEIRRGFAESQKLNQVLVNLSENSSGLKKEIEKLKIDFSGFVRLNDFSSFSKGINSRLAGFESSANEMQNLKSQVEQIAHLVETSAYISKRNEEEIGDIAITIGKENIKRVSDYEEQIASMLKIMSSFAEQISEIKQKLGIKKSRENLSNQVKDLQKNKQEKPKKENLNLEAELPEDLAEKAELPEEIGKEELPEKQSEKNENLEQAEELNKEENPAEEAAEENPAEEAAEENPAEEAAEEKATLRQGYKKSGLPVLQNNNVMKKRLREKVEHPKKRIKQKKKYKIKKQRKKIKNINYKKISINHRKIVIKKKSHK